ncbi:MAG TPA: hypothetical protein VK131_02995 [Candidatus Acidoferrales bacterium]|nr:hypothetical protein [Candidatus Acidoferrales bacterium]
MATPVYIEAGTKRVFALALEWPGWCRSGRDEAAALAALAAYEQRYAVVAREAGIGFPPGNGFAVVERVRGSASTDFGVPGEAASGDARPLKRGEADRMADLVEAAWRVFDRVVAGAPAELRKGPRGGGRDRDAIVEHVLGAEAAYYVRKIGLRLPQPTAGDPAAVAAFRREVAGALRGGGQPIEKGWPLRYAARRIAWHVLDHAWEIEDRS